MKKSSIMLIIFACITLQLLAQTEPTFRNYAYTSDIIPKGHFRYSLFSNAEYGLTNHVTISAHPVWLFLSPSVGVKWELLKQSNYAVVVYHGIACPTPILSLISRKGTGGFISPEFDIPFMLSLKNGLVSTYNVEPNQRITGELGFEFALFNNTLEPGSSIDLPIVSPRNTVYYKNVGFDLSLGMEGKIAGKFDYYGKARVSLFPFKDEGYHAEYGNTNNYFTEIDGLAFWNTSNKFKLGVGWKLCYGDYLFGGQWHLLPMIDFVKYVGKW